MSDLSRTNPDRVISFLTGRRTNIFSKSVNASSADYAQQTERFCEHFERG